MTSKTTKTPAPTTCQICGRPIKANTGRIALHGYKRPGNGWQTSSCWGARYKPYEEACDRLPETIQAVQAHIQRDELAQAQFLAEPPEKLIWAWRNRKDIEVARPDGFDSAVNYYQSCMAGTYEGLFDTRRREYQKSIKASKDTLAFLQARLEAWPGATVTNAQTADPTSDASQHADELEAQGQTYLDQVEYEAELKDYENNHTEPDWTANDVQNAKANELYNRTYVSRFNGCNQKLHTLNYRIAATNVFQWEIGGRIVNAAIDAAMWNCGHADFDGGISLGKISQADKAVRAILQPHAEALAAYEQFIGCFPTGEQDVAYWVD